MWNQVWMWLLKAKLPIKQSYIVMINPNISPYFVNVLLLMRNRHRISACYVRHLLYLINIWTLLQLSFWEDNHGFLLKDSYVVQINLAKTILIYKIMNICSKKISFRVLHTSIFFHPMIIKNHGELNTWCTNLLCQCEQNFTL